MVELTPETFLKGGKLELVLENIMKIPHIIGGKKYSYHLAVRGNY